MYFYFVLLLTLVSSVGRVNGTYEAKQSKVDTVDLLDHLIVVKHNRGVATNRFLRPNDGIDEKRGFGFKSIPGVDKLIAIVKGMRTRLGSRRCEWM
ncbi:Putative RxLR effector, partial [Phytophthora palmivora]